ncbi:MAG: hypothetical protein ACK5P7_06540 [Bdellovibrio sp.]|jgi:hypothetical protein
MIRTLQILFVTLLFPILAQATAMSTEVSKCLAMKSIAKSFEDFRLTHDRFKQDAPHLSFEDRFQVSHLGAQKIVREIERLKALAELTGSDALLDEANRLFRELNLKNITRESALPVLTRGLDNLVDKMASTIDRAENKTQCELTFKPIGINPHAGRAGGTR